jgi:hypothetical protein
MALYFENVNTKRRYRVLALDKVEGTVTMQGEHVKFTEPYDRARFEKLGYRLVKEDDDGASSGSQAGVRASEEEG